MPSTLCTSSGFIANRYSLASETSRGGFKPARKRTSDLLPSTHSKIDTRQSTLTRFVFKQLRSLRGPLVLLASAFGLGMSLPLVHALVQEDDGRFPDSPYLRIDPEKIVLDHRDSKTPCGECHALEYDVWVETPHATGFDELHRRERSQEILDNLDLNSTKRASLCLRCHYTAVGEGESVKAIAGVSCESCHGAARDWVALHNDYGTQGTTVEVRRSLETDVHRAERIEASVEGGMLRPDTDLYGVAANCFECHTVPDEELVNVGGHVAGSGSFDLVSRIGEVQHNFVEAQWSDNRENRAPTPERQRMMFALGRLLGYEYSIRGMAAATDEGKYAKSMERAIQRAYRELDAVFKAAPVPEIGEVLRMGSGLNLAPGNEASLLAAADEISAASQRFAQAHDGSGLAALDGLMGSSAPSDALAETSDPVVTPGAAEVAPTSDPADPAETSVAAEDAETDVPPTSDPAPTSVAANGASAPETPGVEVATVGDDALGPIRQRPAWFDPDGPYETTLPGCSCHGEAEDWWYEDEHFASAEPLLNEAPQAVQIATAYGLTAEQMKRGDQFCMSCHGTAITGTVDVADGVSCESCHGPSSGYLDPHENGGNPQLGMRALKEPAVRAANCARCHHVSDSPPPRRRPPQRRRVRLRRGGRRHRALAEPDRRAPARGRLPRGQRRGARGGLPDHRPEPSHSRCRRAPPSDVRRRRQSVGPDVRRGTDGRPCRDVRPSSDVRDDSSPDVRPGPSPDVRPGAAAGSEANPERDRARPPAPLHRRRLDVDRGPPAHREAAAGAPLRIPRL